jgi:hypothetical protein
MHPPCLPLLGASLSACRDFSFLLNFVLEDGVEGRTGAENPLWRLDGRLEKKDDGCADSVIAFESEERKVPFQALDPS